jgi:KDO2-lipid IV(A) lauroyltransferase
MIFFKLISLTPFWFLYLLSDLLAFIAEHVLQYRKKIIIRNLKKSFPDKTDKEINIIKSLYYKNLTDVALETFKLLTISKEDFIQRVKILNAEKVNKYYKNNISVIATTSHLCNWEWMLAICAIYLHAPIDAVYQQIKNQFFEDLMMKIRSRFGSVPVEKNMIFRESLKNRNSPHVVALVADQSPPLHDENVVWARFLNQNTVFYSGMARMAKSFKWPVVFGEMKRIRRGYYEMEFKDICITPETTTEQEILQNYARMVEESIQKDPHCWLWSHKRWKREEAN